jgi:two-component system chemotaxis response regulator CheY
MGKWIMMVGDSASVRQMVSRTLEHDGYEVMEASDGKDAISKLGHMGVNMVITDLNMPNMDGMELIGWLRSQASYKLIPIIMLTTESQESRKQEGRSAGATGWIVKPFTREQLLGMVKEMLG